MKWVTAKIIQQYCIFDMGLIILNYGFAYKISEQQAVHFITCTVTQWIDIFTRKCYADIVIESLKYCAFVGVFTNKQHHNPK